MALTYAPDAGNSYAALTTHNRSRLKRFSHRQRFAIAAALVDARPGDRVLDFGAGDAFFACTLASTREQVEITAYEPVASQRALAERACTNRRGVAVVGELPHRAQHWQWVTCLEVLEHLPPATRLDALAAMRDALAPGGRIVLSVPLEVGLAGALKNLARALLRQSHAARRGDYLRAALGRPVARDFAGGYAHSHVGFDHRALRGEFPEVGLRVARTVYSPLPAFGGVINAQVFWVLRAA